MSEEQLKTLAKIFHEFINHESKLISELMKEFIPKYQHDLFMERYNQKMTGITEKMEIFKK